jgi:gluconokinase
VRVIHLTGDRGLIRERLGRRAGHFMPAGLLASQIEALEEPRNALVVDIADPPERIVDAIRASLAMVRIPARRSP